LTYGTLPTLPPPTTYPAATTSTIVAQSPNGNTPGKSSRTRFPPISLLQDSLGKLVLAATIELQQYPTLEDYLRTWQTCSDIHPQVQQLPHPAANLLHALHTSGASAQLIDPPWSAQHKTNTLARGSHRSATKHSDFIREEFADMIEKRFWTVLPASWVIEHPELRLSPLGVVPQHERRPRVICDYTFSGVNEATQPTGPQPAIRFGHALRRILTQIVRANPTFGPVLLGKYDLADGFYRIPLNATHAARLACVLPSP
jgi:hypothetical protein